MGGARRFAVNRVADGSQVQGLLPGAVVFGNMVVQHGVAIIPIAIAPNETPGLKLYIGEDLHGKQHRKLVKHVQERGQSRQSVFDAALNKLPIADPLISREFSDGYQYDRPGQTKRGFTRDPTRIHTYLAVCHVDNIGQGDGTWRESSPVMAMSFDDEARIVSSAEAKVYDAKTQLTSLLEDQKSDSPPYKREWVTPSEITDSRSFTYDWRIRFEHPGENPWVGTNATYEPPITEDRVKALLPYPPIAFGDSIYCHNHNCRNANYQKQIEAETVLSIKQESPLRLRPWEVDQLRERGMERVGIELHEIQDGATWYLLIGPEHPEKPLQEGETLRDRPIEISGWYCSPECVDTGPWPSQTHIAIAADLQVAHPSDVPRQDGNVVVSEIRGVYQSEPPESTPGWQENLNNYTESR